MQTAPLMNIQVMQKETGTMMTAVAMRDRPGYGTEFFCAPHGGQFRWTTTAQFTYSDWIITGAHTVDD